MRILCTLSFYIVIFASIASALTTVKFINDDFPYAPTFPINSPSNLNNYKTEICTECTWVSLLLSTII